MPYRVRRNSSGKYCTQKRENNKWKNLKCYSNADEANKYLAALNIAEYGTKNLKEKIIHLKSTLL